MGRRSKRRKQKLEFLTKDYKGRLGDYLNDPENAKRLFDQTSVARGRQVARGKLLAQLLDRLEQQEIIYHVLASYEIRADLPRNTVPPVHLQQLRKALVSKDEMKRVEGVLKHVPARQLSLKPIEDLSQEDPALFAGREIEFRGSRLRRISCGCGAICAMPSI